VVVVELDVVVSSADGEQAAIRTITATLKTLFRCIVPPVTASPTPIFAPFSHRRIGTTRRYAENVTRYELVSEPPMTAPVLVSAFDGWVNAGDAGTAAAEFLIRDAVEVAVFEPDDLFDYRDTRPALTFAEGVVRSLAWPSVTMFHRSQGGRDLLVVTGTEPSLGWQSFASTVADLAGRFGVTELVAMGGIPWAAPHTRPVTLITTGSAAERIGPESDHPEGELTVPGSISGALELSMIERGIPTVGFWARVPNYLGTRFGAASLALLERIDLHLGFGLDLTEMAAAADAQRVHLDAIADGRPDVRSMIEQLEALVDGGSPTSGEQLASEIERFLRNRGDGDFD
jgi:proteasome assembly chaperone (PAC2) family protein